MQPIIIDLSSNKKRSQISTLNNNLTFQDLMINSKNFEQVVQGLKNLDGFDVRVSPDALAYFEKKFKSA